MESATVPEQQLNANGSAIPDAEKKSGPATGIQEAMDANFPIATLVPSPQRWNHPRINMWRSFASFLGLFIMGANDSAYG
ncbi:MAG: hypothetical protein Q9187_008181, partial [Circinaria calcarea]